MLMRGVAASLILAVCFLWFAGRGPYRALGDSGDFTSNITAARAWWDGGNPYANADQLVAWQILSPGGGGPAPDPWHTPAVYPPTLLPLLAPLALLPWEAARLILLGVSLGMTLLLIASLQRLATLSWREPRGLLLTAATLALAPLHAAFYKGNLVVWVVAFIAAAAVAAREGNPRRAGVLLGLAIAIKPPLGLPLALVFLLLRGRCPWSMSVPALVVVPGLLFGLFLAQPAMWRTPWFATWRENLRLSASPGNVNDFSAANPERFQLVNLQRLLSTLLQDRLVVEMLAAFFTMGLFLMLFLGARRVGRSSLAASPDPLLCLSIAAVASLLPVYHRFYDAVLVCFPLAWAIAVWPRQGALPVLVLVSPFFASLAAVLGVWEAEGRLPAAVTDTFAGRVLVAPHQVWALCGIAVALLWRLRQQEDGAVTTMAAAPDLPLQHQAEQRVG